ncbi:MAG: NUDIX domain-containing protein [Anaerolineae bacterium]|jgi:8-oxo-dGTP pyrophosphatase MutT (NUDIX family)|nr:NUDIX domain-containing protein [Chloroflexota bacterium]
MCLNRGPSGVETAATRFGQPAIRDIEIPVTAETLNYWQTLADRRVAEVLLLLRRSSGRYLLHTKAFYPQGAYRLLTGGIHAGEDLIEAAEREAMEETGLTVLPTRFVGILHQRFAHAADAFDFTSYLIELVEQGGVLGVHDVHEQIVGFCEVDIEGLRRSADELQALEGRWADWGAIRAAGHRFAAELLARASGEARGRV